MQTSYVGRGTLPRIDGGDIVDPCPVTIDERAGGRATSRAAGDVLEWKASTTMMRAKKRSRPCVENLEVRQVPSSASLAAEISYSAARGKSGGGFKSLSGTVTGTLAYVPGTYPGSMPELTIGTTSAATGSKGQVFLKNVQIVPITSLVKASTGSFDLVDARNRHVASVTLTGLPDPGAIPDPFPAGSYALLDKFAFRATVPAAGKGHKSSLVQGTVDLSLPQGLPAQDSGVPVTLVFQTSKHGH